jgi:hypothetical protein
MLRKIAPPLVALLAAAMPAAFGAYKARPWSLRPAEAYPARLSSEGVTIAVDPLFLDELAARVFDKSDIVSRGVVPVGVVIFNDNDFPVVVEGSAAELLAGTDRLRSLEPNEVVHRLFAKSGRSVWVPNPAPRLPSVDKSNAAAFEDFDHKFLGRKVVSGRSKSGGFLYLRLSEAVKDVRGFLERSRLYLPDVRRYDTGASMIYFEIDLEQAIRAAR